MGNTYYEYRNVKVKIAHRLMKMDGWKVYGYKADDSDIMTDYYSPADWRGVAEKNGYILVVDVDRERKEPEYYTVRTTERTKTDAETAAKIAKLEQMTQSRGASEQEEATARAKIEVLRNKKAESDEATTEKILRCPAHKANPPRCNWHVEKNGIILDKGNGLLKFSSVPDITNEYRGNRENWQKFNTKTPEEWKNDFIEEYVYRCGEKKREFAEKCAESRYETEKERYALLDKFNLLIARWNNICGGMVSNGSGEDGYIYEEITVTEYKTELKPQECAGEIKDGQCFVVKSGFNYGHEKGYVYRIHEKETGLFVAYRLGKGYKKERTGTAGRGNIWYLSSDFMKWFTKGSLAFCELVEVKTPYEVKKVVKKAVKTEEKGRTENQDKEAQAKKITIEVEKEQEEKRNNYEEIKRQVTSFVYGNSEKLNIEIEHGHYVELIRDGEKISYGSSGYDDVLDKENTIEYTMAEIEECRNYGWNVISIIETTPQAPETPATDEAEEIHAEDTKTVGNATDNPQMTAGESADMFAELARAYVEGKTAPNHKKKTAAPSPVSKSYTEETTGEISGTPSGVQKSDTEYTEPGYHGKTSDILTVGEIAELLDGKQVRKEDGNYKRIFIATPYTDRTSLVYTQDRYQYRDAEDVNPLTPGGDFKFCGFILGKKLYTDKTPIAKKLYEDVERKLQELIPNEGTAKENAADVEKWEQERIDFTLSYNWTGEGRKAFYEDKPPKLALYTGKKEANETEVIRYIENPEAVIKEYAEAYKDNHRADIYRQYIEYNRTTGAYKAILSNPKDEAHRIKAISTSVTNQKTARIELTNGETVKTDAWAVKGIRHDGKIWEHHVAATDRQKLPKDESGRAKDITVSDIVAIYHGQRTLYRAS